MTRVIRLVVGCFMVAACSSGLGVSASVISTLNTIGTGPQRILVGINNGEREPISVDSIPIATLRDENGSPLGTYAGELVWVVPDEQAAYSFHMDIPEAGTYQMTVDTGELGETRPAGFVAVDDPVQVGVAEPAAPLHGHTVEGPLLIVFASTDWCPSESCRPMLDQVADVAAETAMAWISVDVFANPETDTADDLVLSDDVEAWGVPSQPWLYAIDRAGTVVALFEGAVSDEELAEAVALTRG